MRLKKKSGHDHGGEDFVFAVSIRVVGVGRASGSSNADECDDTGRTIEQGVHGVGDNGEAAVAPPDGEF